MTLSIPATGTIKKDLKRNSKSLLWVAPEVKYEREVKSISVETVSVNYTRPQTERKQTSCIASNVPATK